ncbi:hypothetical protein [Kribbella sp. NPDC049227]|uniref:hypothetical protein n=1 Tax=Kribbella sp. NPDC049227 TaxID=3364113 RepID=UPI0037143E92
MTDGLIAVLSEPGDVTEAEFHAWYDQDHGPARLSLPGFSNGLRYRATDDLEPTWLATCEVELTALAGTAYRTARSAERAFTGRLRTFERRVYRVDGRYGRRTAEAAPIVVCLSLTSSDPAGLDAWYREEHIPLLLAIDGWRHTTLGRLVEGSGPELLVVHEIDDARVFGTAAYRHAISTPWRDAVMGAVSSRERRVFAHHSTIVPAG